MACRGPRRASAGAEQPGWWLDLEGPFPLSSPLTLAELRRRGSRVRSVLDGLRERALGSLYFPFFFYGDRELRPMQPYLNKLPAAFVIAMPELADAMSQVGPPSHRVHAAGGEPVGLGVEYRQAEPGGSFRDRDPFTVDPAVVERGSRACRDSKPACANACKRRDRAALPPTG